MNEYDIAMLFITLFLVWACIYACGAGILIKLNIHKVITEENFNKFGDIFVVIMFFILGFMCGYLYNLS